MWRSTVLRPSFTTRAALTCVRGTGTFKVDRGSTSDEVQFKEKVLAVRREDSSVWERRAPLAPSHVRKLVRRGVKVLVQPSNRRAYPMQSYAQAGAIIQEDISEAPLIMGVKQVPVDLLYPNKTYCFFSHTIKAQEVNMPMLDVILERNIRLIDYEKMVDSSGQRVVAFGKWAGVAGFINILHGLGLRLLALGHHTPFMHIGPAHNYRNTGMARQAIRDAGYEIALGMMPNSIGPLTFVFTGSGNVSQGAQEMFYELPHEFVPPEHLKKVAEHGDTKKVYACMVSRRDHLVNKETGGFESAEYEEHPEKYYSNFSKKIAPYASVILNGLYWAVESPKLLKIPDAKFLLRPAATPWLPSTVGSPSLPHRLLAICDISADPGGSIEFMTECTTIDNPFCLYDADEHQNTESFAGPGVLVCSIDNMPTQLPLEATDFFGDLLNPHLTNIIHSDATRPLEEHTFSPVVQGAIIASNGKLTPNFRYIQELRSVGRLRKKQAFGDGMSTTKKKALVLGAGYVSAPTVEYLSRDSNVEVTVASALKEEADRLARRYECESVLLDVLKSPNSLGDVIKESDIVISLLPYSLHHKVASECIKHKVNMVTASYASPEMKHLHSSAQEAGVTILNEVGLDPGIDHFLAMECFDDVKRNGGSVESFVSFCGGLPAPECSANPLRYKFSWSPRGVLLNALRSAKYLKDGKEVEIEDGGNLLNVAKSMNFLPGFNLEGFPNRDSTIYSTEYNIKNAKTLIRGTLRYKGFCNTMKGLLKLGLLDTNSHPNLHPKGPDITWRQFMCSLLGQQDNIYSGNLKSIILDKVGGDESRVEAIEELGLLSEEKINKEGNPLDTLSGYLNKLLVFGENERDIVILRHEILIKWPDLKRELRSIDLVCYGDPQSHSAMAKTVGYPAGIAAKMILDGEIQKKGIVMPFSQEIYVPILSRLKQEGIKATEVIKTVE